jgi:hypothetical protein
MPPRSPTVKAVRPAKLSLRQLQRRMAAAVMRPLTAGYRSQKTWIDGRKTADYVGEFIKPNDRLTSFQRLEIYNKQYWFRIVDCFYDDFPGLRAVLGDNKFDRLTKAYLTAHPSVSYTMRNLGQFLIGYMNKHPEMISPRAQMALDVARLEWAQVLAFDGPSTAAITAADLAGKAPAKLKLALQPHISLLDVQYPVDEFVIAVKKGMALKSDASNAMAESTTHKKKRVVPLPKAEYLWIVVHRHENALYYKRLEPVAFELLSALAKGFTVQKACELALADADPAANWAEKIRSWFETWTALGWFCRRPSRPKGRG